MTGEVSTVAFLHVSHMHTVLKECKSCLNMAELGCCACWIRRVACANSDIFRPTHPPAPPPCRQPGLSVTAVGARRALLLGVQGVEEDVGLIGVHLPGGDFIELVPWNRCEGEQV